MLTNQAKICNDPLLMQNDGTLDYYRQLAETNPDIATLVAMIDNLADQLTIAVAESIKP